MMGAGAISIASWCAARPARRVWLAGAAAVMLAGTVGLAALQHAALPLHDVHGRVERLVSAGRVLLVNRGARSVSFQLQSRALTDDVQNARVSVDGIEHVVPLRPNALTTVTFRLAGDWRVRARGAHRVDVDMDGEGEVILASVHTDWTLPSK
jgi:hypothetical protein